MKTYHRFGFVTKRLLPILLRYQFQRRNPSSAAFLKTCVDFRTTLHDLGPTYIKLGQLLSARPDLVGMELATELRKLLDQIPIIPFDEIEDVLQRTWNNNPKKIFRKIEHTPLATASIAQVHKATMHNGHIVAIKVQRPGIRAVITHDLVIFKQLTFLLDKILPIKGIQFSYIYQEFASWIQNELDFQTEGRRAERFAQNAKDLPGIRVPSIFWDYSSSTVLVMDYLEGYTVNNILSEMKRQKVTSIYDVKLDFAIDPDTLIHRLITAIAQQLLTDKYFHGDLHPANIIIQKNNTVAFVDFGIIGTLNNEEQTQILLALIAIVQGDPQAMVKIISSLIADPLTQKDMTKLHQTFADELHKLHEDENGSISLNHIVTVMLGLTQQYSFKWSSGFLLAIKSIGQIDTLCQLIGLHSSLVELLQPHMEKAIAASFSTTFSQETLYKSLLD